MSTWHYLPVYVEHDGNVEQSLCEVYLDEDGLVSGWTENCSIAPSGSTLAELRADLTHMLNNVDRWAPVRFVDLTVGTRLQPADGHA